MVLFLARPVESRLALMAPSKWLDASSSDGRTSTTTAFEAGYDDEQCSS
jgi:hypothetical protein